MKKVVALAGNPNSGKTTLFNLLTGGNQRVGNWPGVTVDKKEGTLRRNPEIKIQDLPGIYSLSPYSPEEVVSRNYLIEERPDLIVDVVDGSNLVRNLYLATQLAELRVPLVIALNMMDVVEKTGAKIDVRELSERLGCAVVPISAARGTGIDELIAVIQSTLEAATAAPGVLTFSPQTEAALAQVMSILATHTSADLLRYSSIQALQADELTLARLQLSANELAMIKGIRTELEQDLDDEIDSIITQERYEALGRLADAVQTIGPAKLSPTDRIDRIVTSRLLGLPIFILVMFLVYFVSIQTIGTMATDWVNEVVFGDVVPGAVESFMTARDVAPWLLGLVNDGIVAGVGAVLGFLPQMFVLFLCLAILEDSGYMARVAFVMDRIFRRFGLSGKSFIPLMISTGCSMPGIQASRTMENKRDRRLTIMTASFMSCSAKLPVIALIAGAFFGGSAWVTTSFYFIGIAAVIVSGVILKKFKRLAAEPAPFVMEMPSYHAPRALTTLKYALSKSWAFIKRAGTIILLSAIVIWFLSNFDWSLRMVEESGADSILASLGNALAWLFYPLGFNNWQSIVATITGFIAKENVVNTLGIVMNLGSGLTEESPELLQAFGALLNTHGAYSFLLFNMLCMPCFAAVGAIKTEMASTKWTLAAVAWQMGLAYAVSLIYYNLAQWFVNGIFGLWTVVAIAVLILLIALLLRPNRYLALGQKKELVSA